MGENYYEVSIYKYGEEEPVDGFCCYGSVWGIVDMMDSLWLLDAVSYEGWDSYHACISFDGHDLAHMTSMVRQGLRCVSGEYMSQKRWYAVSEHSA